MTTRTNRPDFSSAQHRLFIVGAGFSAPAGLPLTNKLLRHVLRVTAGDDRQWKSHLHDSLRRYRRYLSATQGVRPGTINIEDLATYLDNQHFFGVLGGDTWSPEGNRDQFLLRWGIGAVLHRATPPTIPRLYMEFAERLAPRDMVLTFNYDLLLERALAELEKPFRRYPNVYRDLGNGTLESDLDSRHDDILILKVHGSIDWVDRAPYDRRMANYLADGDSQTPEFVRRRDTVFGERSDILNGPLATTPLPTWDPLKHVWVINDLDTYYANRSFAYEHPPLILAPSHVKQLYGATFKDFWSGLSRFPWRWKSIGIIGFSLPPADPYASQILYELTDEYTAVLSRPRHQLGAMSKIRIVDKRSSPISWCK